MLISGGGLEERITVLGDPRSPCTGALSLPFLSPLLTALIFLRRPRRRAASPVPASSPPLLSKGIRSVTLCSSRVGPRRRYPPGLRRRPKAQQVPARGSGVLLSAFPGASAARAAEATDGRTGVAAAAAQAAGAGGGGGAGIWVAWSGASREAPERQAAGRRAEVSLRARRGRRLSMPSPEPWARARARGRGRGRGRERGPRRGGSGERVKSAALAVNRVRSWPQWPSLMTPESTARRSRGLEDGEPRETGQWGSQGVLE